jgi:hypothetical protein
MTIFQNLFGFELEETKGEIVFFKLFELFVIGATIHLVWQWGAYIPRISDVVLPLGIAQYIDISFMFGDWNGLINAGLITALVIVGYFRLWRFAYLTAFLLVHLQYAARFSLGEIPHSSNLIVMSLLGLALAMPAFTDAVHRRRFALGFTYFFIGLGYTLAGISKLGGTGLGWADGRHLWMWVNEKSVDVLSKTGVFEPNFMQEIVLTSLVVATLFLAIGILTELFAFLVWFRKLRTPVILAVLGLHIGIDLIMNIFFYLSVMLLVILGFPWAKLIDRALEAPVFRRVVEPFARLALRFA